MLNCQVFLAICRSLINERSTRNWPELLNNYLGFDGISAQPLLEYFQPLEEYFEKAPQTQSPYSTTQRTVITTSTSTTIKPKPERKKSKFDRKSPKNVTEPPTPILAANETKKDEGYKNVENSLDQDSLDLDNNRKENMLPHKAEIFIAIGVLVCITIFTVLFVLRKKLRRKRKGNNRRFET